MTAPSITRRLSIGLGAFALASGLVSLWGWGANMPRLADWEGDGIAMQPNTALAAACAGAALIAGTRLRWLLGPLAILCGAIGALTLFQHLTGLDLGIDRLLLFGRPWGAAGTVAHGRMGPPASFSFTLLGLGLLLLLGRPGGGTRAAASKLGLAVIGVGLLALTGYLFGADMLYALPRITGIAFQTAFVVLALGLGLVAAVPEHHPVRILWEDSAAGMLARRGLPIILVLPIVVGWIRLKGQEALLYDTAMGTASLVVVLIFLMCGVLWWGVAAVSSRERALAAVHDVKSRADMVLRSVRDQFVVLDRDWRYTYVNDRVIEVTGIPRESYLGHTIWATFPALRGGELETVARRVMERRTPEAFEHYYQPWDRWFDTRISPTDDGGLAFFVLEITDRKRAEQRLREADVRKDQFLATLAHELRGPLAPVRNWLEIMKRDRADAAMMEQGLASMERQLGQMVRLIDDLLDVSRITRDRLELHKQRVELRPILEQAIEACRPTADQKRHELLVSVPKEPILLQADPVRLVQVFDNLITNACKFTEAGGRIQVRAIREGGDAVVTVKDNGCGIAPEMQPKVFEMFIKTDPPTVVTQGGLGLGLALVKRLVELHDGKVTVKSDGPGTGSEFVVRLPALVETNVPSQAPELPTDTSAIAGRRFLVVDDNPDTAESLALLLNISGCETQTAHDGVEAMEKASSYRPHVILLDIGLPRMSGYEVCQAIRAESWGEGMVIVALTGWGQDGDRRTSLSAGFDHHLVKPVRHEDLTRLLTELLASPRA